ncbi:MAG: hypothetical protein LW690_11535 [Opitutaceae bacterium]|nr:hypothetical protein [Opitutaceae bacterium]
MPEETESPKRKFRFKPTAFETVNERWEGRPPDASPDPGPEPAHAQAGSIDVHDLLREAARGVPVTGVHRGSGSDNEVRSVLREEQARQEEAGLFETGTLDDSVRRRRLRRYVIVLVVTGVAAGTIALLTGPRDPLPFTLAVAGFGAFSAWLTWRTFFLRTHYDE